MLVTEWTRQVAASFDKQIHLHDLVSALDWEFDLSSGVLSFGTRYYWSTQLLGTESEVAGTWLWAWANDASAIPDRLLEACRTVRTFGAGQGIPELVEPSVPLTDLGGHAFALLAAGVCTADAYYRCPFEGGALFVLIRDWMFPKCPEPPLARIASVFPRLIAALDIPDHRLALTGYLTSYGLGYEVDASRVVVRQGGDPVLTATFDAHDRLTNLDVEVRPTPAPPVESWDELMLQLALRG